MNRPIFKMVHDETSFRGTFPVLATLIAAWGLLVFASGRLLAEKPDKAPAKPPQSDASKSDAPRAEKTTAKESPASESQPASGSVVKVDRRLVEQPTRAILSGKVVLLSESLARRDIKAYPEELEGQVVLETNDGKLFPIVPDWRGRAFYQDERLRDRPVDLLVRQRQSIPHLQVLSIYTFDDKGARQLTDYWCDICSIPMYEIKDCECCQGPIRLRFQPKDLPADLAEPPAAKPAVKASTKPAPQTK